MSRQKLIFLTLFLLIFCQSKPVEAQACTPEEKQEGNQYLALANAYEQQRDWEKAADIYSQVSLSPCPEISDTALIGLQRTLAIKESWLAQFQERLFNLSLAAAVVVGAGIFVFLFAMILIWLIDRADRWVITPFVDLTGNKMGDAIAESLNGKMHEIRLLYSKPPYALIGLSEGIDLPSFSLATQESSLLSALSSLDSLDVSGIGLPIGSAMSSMMRWLDLGGRRLFGSIQRWDNKVTVYVRLEEGRGGRCIRVWKASDSTTTEMTSSSVQAIVVELAYRILFDITPDSWGTSYAAAFQSFTDGLEQLNIYYESNSRNKSALQRARVDLVTTAQIDPAYHLATFYLALVDINAGEHDAAITLLKGILRNIELQPQIYYNLGVAYYQKTSDWAYDQAEEFFNRVLDEFSNRQADENQRKLLALAHCGLTSIAAQRSRLVSTNQETLWAMGESHYRQALALASENKQVYAQAQYSLATLHLNRKEYDRALSLLEESLTLNPYHWRAYTALGQVAMAINKYDDAIVCLRKATALSPDFEYAYYQLGRAYMLSELSDKDTLAIEAFAKAPNIARAHIEMGKILAEGLEEYRRGIDCFERAIELNSRSADAYANLAWYLTEGELLEGDGKERAMDAAERAVEITRHNDWHKLAVLGRVCYECQEYDKTRLILEEANQLNPEAPQVYYHLALLEFAEQEYQLARQHLISLFRLTEQGIWKEKAVSLMREVEEKLHHNG